jgi:hypothetical protein
VGSIDRELKAAVRHLATKSVRVFLHTLAYEYDAPAFLDNIGRFLDIATASGIRTGIVLFDSCWNTAGANVSAECMPVKGRHNGCWYESPQAADMTSLARYQSYVTDVVSRYGNDTRVNWIEIYNEPRAPNADFVFALRDAGYRWAAALNPIAPIISCWDDNNDTNVVDHHDYTSSFASEWEPAVFVNPSKGAVITEAGSRWYQPPFAGDYGSPLLVVNFLEALAKKAANGTAPYVPGAMISWEIMVGNSHTRWHWGSADGALEPAIPWCGNLMPDGSPVSYTEAAALRRYITGRDEFLAFDKFIPGAPTLIDGDFFLSIAAGSANAVATAGGAPIGDALFEAAIWLTSQGAASMVVRASAALSVTKRASSTAVGELISPLKRHQQKLAPATRAALQTCSLSPILNDTDACPGGPVGYRDFSLAGDASPLDTCASACCAWSECTAWVVRNLSGATDHNCTNELCCWLKPLCPPSEASHSPGTVAQYKTLPPGPPLPSNVDGYNVTIDAASSLLSVSRCANAGVCTDLGSVNVSAFEPGLVLNAWNLLRFVLETDSTTGSLRIRVWFNPTVPETGFTGDPVIDASLTPKPLPPRLTVTDSSPLPAGGIVLCAGGEEARVDYVSALPANVL